MQITTNNSNQNNKKFGFVSLIGETNSGKSTLVNQLVGKKVSQISHKVQFTRGKILGIYTKENYQIAFVDTPGIFTPKKLLDKSMVKLAYREINDSDSILFVLDSQKGITNFTESLIEKFKNLNKDIYLVLNKVDLVDKSILLKISNDLNSLYNFKFTFMISALTGKGVNDILKKVKDSLLNSNWFYDADSFTDTPISKLAEEITREKIYEYSHQEIPYLTNVVTEKFNKEGNHTIIHQVIIVSKDSHRVILLGQKGNKIKTISMASRKEIEYILNEKISLFLFIKTDANWQSKKEYYDNMGLDFNS